MANQFKYLFSPLRIGNMTVKNRIVVTGHNPIYGFTNDENDGQQYIEYIRARAKGGVGLIIGMAVVVHPTSEGYDLYTPSHDIFRAKLRRLADAVHEHDAKIIMQLAHMGREFVSTHSIKAVQAFSALPSPDMGEMPHEMTTEEIEEIIDCFVAYAVDCKEGGMDGIELHGSHGYLLQQSWSWWANRRDDRFGEPMAFAYELLKRIREAVGEDFVICVRMSSDDFMPNGLNVEHMKEIAKLLENTGHVDLLNMSEGALAVTYAYSCGTMYVPLGAFVPLVATIREELTRVPIMAVGRIKDPVQAEKILADGQADLVGMTRANIVDPEISNKSMAGELDDIRKCIACNIGCFDRHAIKEPITCVQNPTVGREKELGTLERATTPKKVMIVGAGPSGMECARIAALRGHQVEVYEKEAEPGGQLRLAIKDPARLEFEDLTRYQSAQLTKLGVPVHTGIEVTEELIREKQPECLVVATGSIPRELHTPISEELIPGYDEKIVMTLFDVYLNPESIGENVLLFDGLGVHQGLTTALWIAGMGKKVEIVTPLPCAGMNLGVTYMPLLYERLHRAGAKFSLNLGIKAISGHTVELINVYNFAVETRENVDTLVVVAQQRAQDGLFRSMRKEMIEVHAIGDALAPGGILRAVHEGYHLGRKI